MARVYRRRGRQTSRTENPQIVGRQAAAAGNVTVELPVALADVIEGVSAEVEQLAGQAGLLIMQAVMEAEVEQLVGPKGRHDPQRTATRWGGQPGYVVLAGKKVHMHKPRMRDPSGQELPLRSYARFQGPPRRQRSIVRQLIHGISTRKYERAIEDFTTGYGISKSAVSREFVAATRGRLAGLCERRIGTLPRMVVLLIDGKEFAGECVVVALGVDETGKKHVLGLVQGATENATVVQGLLDDLVERGLDPRAKRLYVLDGAKALRAAVRKTFGEASLVQRCQVHKQRNVAGYLGDEHQGQLVRRLRAAYGLTKYAAAKKLLMQTVGWLEEINPSAAASLREGLEETLTLHRLRVPEELRRSLRSTNLIENALSVAADLTRRVKRWHGGDMRLRWTAAGLLAAERRFHRIKGCKSMPVLIAALDACDAKRLAGQPEAA
jgi:putative transposase